MVRVSQAACTSYTLFPTPGFAPPPQKELSLQVHSFPDAFVSTKLPMNRLQHFLVPGRYTPIAGVYIYLTEAEFNPRKVCWVHRGNICLMTGIAPLAGGV